MLTLIDSATGTEIKHRVGQDFILAGKATFTLSDPHGDHRTFRVVRKEAGNGYPEAFFVSLLSGPDNESDYTYLGKLDPFTGQVVPTAKSGWTQVTRPGHVVALNRVLARVWCDDHEAFERAGWTLRHAMKCGRCGRTLTHPDSIASGIGPECAKRTDSGKCSTK